MATINDKGKEPIIEPAAPEMAVQLLTPLYVGDLDERVTAEDLKHVFNQIGGVDSVKICTDQTTERSRGYGYVNYIDPQHAAKALEDLNFIPLYGRQIRVAYSNKDESQRKSGLGNIFVKKLDNEIDNKALHDIFSQFGTIVSSKVATDSSAVSKGYGFVQYSSEESAKKAIEELNGIWFNGNKIFVRPFLSKREREMSTKLTNVFVKNLSEHICDENIHNMFVEFGEITSAVVMRNEEGISKGFGFVNFANANDAARALSEMNGKIILGKPLYVAFAQRKEDRQAHLQAQFGQSRPITMGPTGGLGPGQHMFFAHPPRAIMPSQMLGENLYLVEQLVDEMATKMSEMLSEMNWMEVLHLLASPQAFKSKFAEAMEVMRSVSQKQAAIAAEQLATLLND